MKIFEVNKYITLKLEEEKTIIYINKDRFDQCKALVLSIPIIEMKWLKEIESIDEAADKLKRTSKETVYSKIKIPIETEFWGHCSNLQVWVENNYDTRLLHRNLAFPLLKKLAEVGDLKAKKVFKEEIAKRFNEGYPSVTTFLVNSELLKALDKEEFMSLLNSSEANALIDLEEILNKNLKILRQDVNPYTQGFWLEGKKIVGLFLEDCNLKYLPDSIGKIRHLKYLYLNENLLKELPVSIGRLKSLEILDIRNNKLHSIPNSIGNLKNLKELRLSDNKLKTLPKTLDKLKLLNRLSLAGNELEIIPEFIKQMKKIGKNILY